MSGLRLVGVVVRWNSVGGYGFIQRKGASDVFVHASGVLNRGRPDALSVGDLVAFSIEESPRGLIARLVERLPRECPKCEAVLRSATCAACGFTYSP